MEYKSGREFVDDLVREHGLLEGYRIAEEYLKASDGNDDSAFTAEIKYSLWELDQL